MVFYEYTYHLDQDLSKVFEYFLQKAYLVRFFKDSSDEVVLNSDEENPYLEVGEKMELVIGDKESISSFEIDTLEIQEEILIDLSIKFTDIVDKSNSSLEDDAETFDFMKKHWASTSSFASNSTMILTEPGYVKLQNYRIIALPGMPKLSGNSWVGITFLSKEVFTRK